MKSLYVAVFLLLLAGLYSCDEKPPLNLTTAQRDQVDTLFLRKVNQGRLAAEMDSLCTATRQSKIQRLVDSMLQVRRAEEEALRKRYGQ